MARLKILDLKARSGTETARGAMVLEGTVNANEFQITHLEVSFGSTARKVMLDVPQTLNFSGALPGNIEELFFKVSGQTLTLRVDLASEPDFAQIGRASCRERVSSPPPPLPPPPPPQPYTLLDTLSLHDALPIWSI